MKAAVFHGPGGSWPQKPISIEEVPVPVPAAGEVLVKVAACGLCRTDLEYLKVAGATPKPPPIILGHEPVGTVTETGREVNGLTAGQRVLVATAIPCFVCDFCRTGRENLCPGMTLVGANRDGAFAEYVTAPATGVIPLPDSLPLEASAIITDAVATSYHAVYNRARVKKGDTVAIYGASGGLGLICVQMTAAIGARVIAIGRKQWKLAKAKEYGAAEIISTGEVDSVDRAVKRLTGDGADISIDVSGLAQMIESACRATRPGGSIIVVGFSFEKIQLSVNRLMWQELNVLGSKNYRLSDMPAIIGLVKNGVVQPDKIVSHRFKLEEINEAYRMLERGEMLRGIVIP
jgi:2-desacetyl-2-hydroxyethyl bacteriochlorophyllide A dehydrogenase